MKNIWGFPLTKCLQSWLFFSEKKIVVQEKLEEIFPIVEEKFEKL